MNNHRSCQWRIPKQGIKFILLVTLTYASIGLCISICLPPHVCTYFSVEWLYLSLSWIYEWDSSMPFWRRCRSYSALCVCTCMYVYVTVCVYSFLLEFAVSVSRFVDVLRFISILWFRKSCNIFIFSNKIMILCWQNASIICKWA